MHTCACTCLSSCSYLFPLGVTVRYEEELYSVKEEAGYVTLALVLEGDAAIPVTVFVNTLDLQDSSVGAAATGELFKFACCCTFYRFAQYSLQLAMWSDVIGPTIKETRKTISTNCL